MARFSKDEVALNIARRVKHLQDKHNFNLGTGTVQLRGTIMSDKGIDRCVDYGAIRALTALANDYDLGDLVRQKVSELGGGHIE